MKKTLTVSLYNRPEYTKRVLTALDQCYGVEEYEIDIFCDPGSEDVVNIAKQFRPSQSTVVVNNVRFGCNSNIYQCLSAGFKKNDYHIHLEDDTVPGKDCLKYFEWARNEYKDNQLIFTVSGYVNSDNPTEHYYPKTDDTDSVSTRQWFTPWGWATWVDRWKEMKEVWDFSGKNGSWDTTLTHEVRKNRYEVIPCISRIQNIGAIDGTHVPNPDWHKIHHFNNFWIETINKYTFNYKQI